MRRLLVALAACLLSVPATSPAKARDVTMAQVEASEVLLRRGHSKHTVILRDPKQVQEVVTEINRIRLRPWHSETIIKHGRCLMQVDLLRAGQITVKLYVYADKVFEIPRPKRNPHFFTGTASGELIELRKALRDLGLPEGCRW